MEVSRSMFQYLGTWWGWHRTQVRNSISRIALIHRRGKAPHSFFRAGLLLAGLLLVLYSNPALAANTLAVVSSASYTTPVAPSSIAEGFGSDLATKTLVTPLPVWPLSLGGTTVSVTDSAGVARSAPIDFVSSGQVNFQIPPQTAVGTATVTIVSGDGTSSTGTVEITVVAPGLYSANANGQGAAAAIVVEVAGDGSQISSFPFACGSTPLSCIAAPIVVDSAPGQTILELYGTGIKNVNALADVSATIGGTSAKVLYAGAQGVYQGLDQVNLVIPTSLANQGLVDVKLTVQGRTANTVEVNIGPVAITTTQNFFVAPNGNDQFSGSLPAPNSAGTDGPLASIAKAQSVVRTFLAAHPTQPISIQLRSGTYYLPASPTSPGTLNFTSSDSGSAGSRITWQNYPGETPVVSGGMPLGKSWKNVSGSLWQTQLPASTQPFEYLFYNGERRMRSRVAASSGVGYYMQGGSCVSTSTGKTVELSQCNLGTFFRVAAEIPPTGADANCPSATNSGGTQSKCLDRFGFDPNDPIADWINLNASGSSCGGGGNLYPVGDVEVTLFAAWTVDVMRISCVDTNRNIIYFTAATEGNSGTSYNMFGPTVGHRYVVDNTLDAFNAAQSDGETGIWFLDRSTSPWTLNYLANSGENPNSDSVVIAQVSPATSIGGSLIAAVNLEYVTFQGITFEADNFVPSAAGFNNDENGESTLPAAIDCESCQNVTFDSVVVRHTSASGIQIASTAGNSGAPGSNDVIQNSAFYDIGSSGLHIGHHPAGSDRAANVVQFVTVQNNIVQGYSRVFADGEGFAQGNGHDITYLHNDITDGYHAGISICLLGCPSMGFAANGVNILSKYNHIWNVIQGITADGGALYYNVGATGGSGTGNNILNNLVHDVTDASILDAGVKGSGYGGHGIYLDIQSANMNVENNVVYNVAGSTTFVHEGPALGQTANTFNNNIFAYGRASMFEEQNPWPQGCNLAASPQVNVSNNIFYFDLTDSSGFYVTQGCADSCGLPFDQFQNFEGNLYWRTDGKFSSYDEAFHILTNPPSGAAASSCDAPANPQAAWTFMGFSQWQSSSPALNGKPFQMKEDVAGTTTVNPGFGNSGLPADYILSASPLAGFSFVNTNDTILLAGRSSPVIVPPTVPQTYPTYAFTQF
jgi:uncharacterized protein (TIGR03437 family)